MAWALVLDDLELMLLGNLADRDHVGALAVEVDGNDGLGLGRDGGLNRFRANALGRGAAINEDGSGSAIQMASAVAKKVFGWVMTSSPGRCRGP